MTEPVRPMEALIVEKIAEWRSEPNRKTHTHRMADELEAALLQAAAPPAPTAEPLPALEWQPIATAPKDGSEFIGWNGHRAYVLAWDVDHWDVRGGQLQILRLHPATYWLPLPAVDSAPPERVSEGKEP